MTHIYAHLDEPLPAIITRPIPIQAPKLLPDRPEPLHPAHGHWSRTFRHYTLARHLTHRRGVARLIVTLRSIALRTTTWRGNRQWDVVVQHLPSWIADDHACMQRYVYDPIQRLAYKRRQLAHPELY